MNGTPTSGKVGYRWIITFSADSDRGDVPLIVTTVGTVNDGSNTATVTSEEFVEGQANTFNSKEMVDSYPEEYNHLNQLTSLCIPIRSQPELNVVAVLQIDDQLFNNNTSSNFQKRIIFHF